MLRCLLDSIQRSQAVAWCVVRFRHGSEKYAFSKEKVNQHDVAVTVSSFWQAVHKSMTVQKPHLLMKPHQLS